jgi:energy-coupling factor transporter ATP-binding protein EcfA2
VLLLDEATSGLDSASTAALIASMARWARLLNSTVVMALQQPDPAELSLFDDVILMSHGGHTLWHGPADAARQHFADVAGLAPAPGQDMAAFLEAVAAGAAAAAAAAGSSERGSSGDGGGSGSSDTAAAPCLSSPAQVAAAFWASERGAALQVRGCVPSSGVCLCHAGVLRAHSADALTLPC